MILSKHKDRRSLSGQFRYHVNRTVLRIGIGTGGALGRCDRAAGHGKTGQAQRRVTGSVTVRGIAIRHRPAFRCRRPDIADVERDAPAAAPAALMVGIIDSAIPAVSRNCGRTAVYGVSGQQDAPAAPAAREPQRYNPGTIKGEAPPQSDKNTDQQLCALYR